MATGEFTLDDLRRMLRTTAGEDAGTSLDDDILDMGFDELGYDSLAMLEAGRCIELECGIALEDTVVTSADTPRALLAAVNEELAARQVS